MNTAWYPQGSWCSLARDLNEKLIGLPSVGEPSADGVVDRWKFTEMALQKPLEAFLEKSVKTTYFTQFGCAESDRTGCSSFKMAGKQDGRHQADVK